MVRFIIISDANLEPSNTLIYIPIWLDLLLSSKRLPSMLGVNLHSNMVRFIMPKIWNRLIRKRKFTFQYG